MKRQWKSERPRPHEAGGWSFQGIYFIFDTSDQKGYIGSAYGKDHLLGRWLNYAKTGHGGNPLEKAIAAYGGPVKMRWLPFQLNPTMPKEGISRKEYRIKKFGSWERSQELDAKVVAVGEAEGIHFAFDRIERTPNTVDAHRLIWLADQQGCQDAVVEALFRAYFTLGLDTSNRHTLIGFVVEAGLKWEQAVALLNSDEGMDAIKEVEGLSQRHGVSGVPFFIINDNITLSGAQQPDTFVEAFNQAVDPT